MSKIIDQSIKQIRQAILEAMGRAVAKGSLPAEPIPDFKIEVPADRAHGDYAANIAMVSARTFRMAPRKIAELILESLDLSGTYAKSVEIAGAGFINFHVSQDFYSDIVCDILDQGENYGRSEYGKGQKIVVGFV